MIGKTIHYRPTRATTGSAGHDLYAPEGGRIAAGGSIKIKTGVYTNFPKSVCAVIKSRSGLAWNHSVVAFEGLIDSDYEGEIGVKLFNHGSEEFVFTKGDRIAQLAFMPVITDDTTEIISHDRVGGYGSTGQ